MKQTSYEDTASLAEEKHFLKNYSIPFVQLEPQKTILVFSHEHNTFDKRKLLKNQDDKFVKESSLTVSDFIKESDMKLFYTETICELLKNYEPGKPKYKPDVIQQTKEIEEHRKKMFEESQRNGKIMIQMANGENKVLNNQQIVQMLQQYQSQLNQNTTIIGEMQERINTQQEIINSQQNEFSEYKNKVELTILEKDTVVLPEEGVYIETLSQSETGSESS